MRVVIDTNVFVSSFFGGTPRKIIDLWKNGDITLCLSRDILDEYVKVLQRIGLQDESELKELLSLFARGFNTLFTIKTPKIRVVKDDPDDDKFIECALELSIKALGEYMGIKILTPQEFLKDYKIY